MVEIPDENLDFTDSLLMITEKCRFSHNCLWRNRKDLPFIFKNNTDTNCQKDNCPVVLFRKKFESDSPAFYFEVSQLARTKTVIKHAMKALETHWGSARQRRKRYLRRLDTLRSFDHTFLLAVYPLYLQAQTIPAIKKEEFLDLLKRYNNDPVERNRHVEGLYEINEEWAIWLGEAMYDLFTDSIYTPPIIYFILYVFLKGLEKNELPDFKKMSFKEKADFFTEINQAISKNTKD